MTSFLPVKAEDYKKCMEQRPVTIETSMGPVEYAARGEGPVLLSVHGGPGGYDQGLAISESFRLNGFRIIAPSRPGYLGTPLSSGQSLESQGDALAALLDVLGLDRVAVLGASAGGPSTYLMAQNHPDRVSALIEIDSVCMRYTKADEISKAEELLFMSKAGMWLMDFLMSHFPAAMIKSFLQTESSLAEHEIRERVRQVLKDPAKLAMVEVLSRTMTTRYEERKAGVANDLEKMRSLDRLPLDKVDCPTLIIHGNADNDVPPAQAEYAARSIADSELYWIDKGSHMGFWLADAAETVQQYAVKWLREQVS
ncbi:alpha/beta hydrolase [Maridesulfovibrio sp.]|uniref:alpha/beta fold hydrolase n=1 Tax=Maridesulfovibrio sp. TaxID=2795000 RepID=UPI0029CA14BB|nr:alpha/beta hydrolase [Maridesulfovibrio sp.]